MVIQPQLYDKIVPGLLAVYADYTVVYVGQVGNGTFCYFKNKLMILLHFFKAGFFLQTGNNNAGAKLTQHRHLIQITQNQYQNPHTSLLQSFTEFSNFASSSFSQNPSKSKMPQHWHLLRIIRNYLFESEMIRVSGRMNTQCLIQEQFLLGTCCNTKFLPNQYPVSVMQNNFLLATSLIRTKQLLFISCIVIIVMVFKSKISINS